MVDRMKYYDKREFKQILIQNGYEVIRSRGSHKIWSNGTRTISVPNVKLNACLIRRLIRDYDIVV